MAISLGSAIFRSSNGRGDSLSFDLSGNFSNSINAITNFAVNGVMVDVSAVSGIVNMDGDSGVSVDLAALLDYLRQQDQKFWSNNSIDDVSPILELTFNVTDSQGNVEAADLQVINNVGSGFLIDDYAPIVKVTDSATLNVLAGEGAEGLTVTKITGLFFDDNPSGAGANGTGWISEDVGNVTINANGTITINTTFLENYASSSNWIYYPEVKVEYTVSDGNGGEYTAEAFFSVMKPDADFAPSQFQYSEYFNVDLLDTNWEDVYPNSNFINSPDEFRTVKPVHLHLFANNGDSINVNGNQNGHSSIISINSVNQNGSTPNFGISASDLNNLVEIVDAANGIIRFNSYYLFNNYLNLNGEFISIFSINIEYTVDNGGTPEQAIAHIQFDATNRAPVTQFADVETVDVGEIAILDVMEHDSDPDGDRIMISDITGAQIITSSGTQALSQAQVEQMIQVINGEVHVDTSLLADFGIDIDPYTSTELRIFYEITDNFGATDTGYGRVFFNTLEDLVPDARNDVPGTFNIDEYVDEVICIDVLNNDIPGNGDLTIVPNGFANLVINGVQIPNANIGDYITIVDNQVKFNFDNINVPRGGKVGITFDYTVKDEDGDTDTAKVIFYLQDPNAAPIAADAVLIEDEDALVDSGAVAGSYTDMDESEGVQVTNQGEIGELIFSYAYATDADATDTLTYSINTNIHNVMTDGNGQQFIMFGNYKAVLVDGDKVQFDPQQFQELDAGDSRSFNLHYTVSDGLASDNGVVTIRILGTNDAPVAENVIYCDFEDGSMDADENSIAVDGSTIYDGPDSEAATYLNAGDIMRYAFRINDPDANDFEQHTPWGAVIGK